jgi:serine protease
MKRLSLFLTLLMAVCLISGFAVNEKPINKIDGKPSLVPDEIIVTFAPDVSENAKGKIKALYNLTLKRNSKKPDKFGVYKHKNPTAILNKLKNEPGVLYAEQNAYAYATMYPNDPYYSPYQWHMTRIGMEDAWDISTGASSVVVAINDTGVKQSLEDLAQTNFMAGYDFINDDNDPTDDEGHGSHVCGTVAQSTNNNIGVTGVAFNTTIMPVKVLNAQGSGSYDQIADGIYYATDNGADVINMSLSGPSDLSVLKNAIDYAWNNGVVIVCAAGNDSTSAPQYPAAYTNSISVSATNYLDQLADYSNYGSTIDICAPGGDGNDYNGDGYMDGVLQNTFSGTSEGYYFYTGTSMACPHVAGVAALCKAINSGLSNAQIRSILETTAEDLGASGWDQYFGHGMVDAYAACLQAQGGNQPPVADFTYVVNDLTVTFTDQSYDPDGTIVSWLWNFGDSNTSTAQNPVHTYASSGTYSVTLTVTDNDGATDSVSKDVSVGSVYMFVYDIAMSIKKMGRNYSAKAIITIMDTNSNPVANATVFATWSGCYNGSVSGVTGSDGKVTFQSPKAKCSGPFTITINNVTHATIPYDPGLNNETSDSISY